MSSYEFDAYLAVGTEGVFMLGDKLLGPVDEVVGLARGLRAVRTAKAGKNIAKWTTKELGEAIKNAGDVKDFLKVLDKADFDKIWSNDKLQKSLANRIRRQAFGGHHWFQISLLPKLMERPDKQVWIEKVFGETNLIRGWEDTHRLEKFHDELRAAYRPGMSLDDYLEAVKEIAAKWQATFR